MGFQVIAIRDDGHIQVPNSNGCCPSTQSIENRILNIGSSELLEIRSVAFLTCRYNITLIQNNDRFTQFKPKLENILERILRYFSLSSTEKILLKGLLEIVGTEHPDLFMQFLEANHSDLITTFAKVVEDLQIQEWFFQNLATISDRNSVEAHLREYYEGLLMHGDIEELDSRLADINRTHFAPGFMDNMVGILHQFSPFQESQSPWHAIQTLSMVGVMIGIPFFAYVYINDLASDFVSLPKLYYFSMVMGLVIIFLFSLSVYKIRQIIPTTFPPFQNYTEMAREGRFERLLGNQDTCTRLLSLLSHSSCETKTLPILVGKPGVGKDRIIMEIARLIASKNELSPNLASIFEGKQMIVGNATKLLPKSGGENHEGDPLDDFIKRVAPFKQDVILVFNEAHVLFQNQRQNNLMKDILDQFPYLILITTPDECDRYIKLRQDISQGRRLMVVGVEPLDNSTTEKILEQMTRRQYPKIDIGSQIRSHIFQQTSERLSAFNQPDISKRAFALAVLELRPQLSERQSEKERIMHRLIELRYDYLRRGAIDSDLTALQGQIESLRIIEERYEETAKKDKKLDELLSSRKQLNQRIAYLALMKFAPPKKGSKLEKIKSFFIRQKQPTNVLVEYYLLEKHRKDYLNRQIRASQAELGYTLSEGHVREAINKLVGQRPPQRNNPFDEDVRIVNRIGEIISKIYYS